MRVVVTGATGNVGTSVVRALVAEPAVTEIVGLARRRPELDLPKVSWKTVDLGQESPRAHVEGADAVIHLAWRIQSARAADDLHEVNVGGTLRLLDAVAAAEVPVLLYASSIGAYSAGPNDRRVDEQWPTNGIATSLYSLQKAYVERVLDAFELRHPDLRLVRMRPTLIAKASAGSQLRRLFLGGLFPNALASSAFVPVFPNVPGLRFTLVHSDDVAEAFRLALLSDVRGPLNISNDPVIGPETFAEILGAKLVPMPASAARAVLSGLWWLGLQPTDAGWFDLARRSPIPDDTRARETLGWVPRRPSDAVLAELVRGVREGAGADTPPLHADAPGG